MDLHITNGDATGDMLKSIDSIEGEILCWRDLLHDGPVREMNDDDFADLRADFLWQSLQALEPTSGHTLTRIRDDFRQRQAVLDRLDEFDQITLWFEHDLYDQLQLIEILKCLGQCENLPPVYLICIDQHQDIEYFYGLGNLNLDQLQALYPSRKLVSVLAFKQAGNLWQALTHQTPELLSSYLSESMPELPFMQAGLLRFAQEYPCLQTGLTATQSYLLKALYQPLEQLPAYHQQLIKMEASGQLADAVDAKQRYRQMLSGPMTFGRLFLSLQALETAPFMGDLWVKKELDLLCQMPFPLLKTVRLEDESNERFSEEYCLTARGIDLVQGQGHWLDHNGYDFWRGGVHIQAGNLWFWDQNSFSFRSGQV